MNFEYCNGYTHTIKKGDTLYGLSRRYRVPLALILRANPYVDVYNLQVGDTVCIPVRKAEECMPCVTPTVETPAVGSPTMRTPMMGTPAMGTPAMGTPAMGTPIMEPPTVDTPAAGNPMGGRNRMREAMPEEITGEFTEDIGEMAADDLTVEEQRQEMTADSQEEMQYKEVSEDRREKRERYVAESGDTLEDVLEGTGMKLEEFVEKNSPDKIYMLPGVGYYTGVEKPAR